MLLGTKRHGAGNTCRYEIDYTDWLADGESLLSATVVMDDDFTATVTDVSITSVLVTASHRVFFTLVGGSANETFTLNVQTTTQHPTEIKKDTMNFVIV